MTATFERRLRAEWDLLNALAALNPDRLISLQAEDTTLRATLSMPQVVVPGWESAPPALREHAFSVHFPVHFPAVPMEMFLDRPVHHPNIHPETGFVCLWDRHRASNTVEHAVHKLAAMLDGTLYNPDAVHLMQSDALADFAAHKSIAVATPLRGVAHDAYIAPIAPLRRRRLQ